MSIEFPQSWSAVRVDETVQIRAGGTEIGERRRLMGAGGQALPALVDLRDVAGSESVETLPSGGLRLGARLRIAALAKNTRIQDHYPGLSEAAGGLATPQIRAVATVAGNLLQATRCWYYRSPEVRCLKRGGEGCPARAGDHLFHGCFDPGPCISVHPSTLGTALWAYDAELVLASGDRMGLAELYRDGSDPTVDHHLPPDQTVVAIELPAPANGEHAAYVRAISRARAEWPLVEVVARFVVEEGKIAAAAIAVGGVAPRPRRLVQVEEALVGSRPTLATFERASALASRGSEPLPMTGYKAKLMGPTVLEALELGAARQAVHAPTPSPDASASAAAKEPK